MLTLPAVFIDLLAPFMPVFRSQTWTKAQLLLVGAVLSPGKRTVTAALRVLGLGQEIGFAKYHHVLNRARWSSVLTRLWNAVGDGALAPGGSTGMPCAPVVIISSRPAVCAGSA
jgi:hypothetical protein